MSIIDYYKYAALATAAYVRMGDGPLDGATFAREASSDDQQRLPLSIGTALFNPADTNAPRWNILHYYGSDNTGDPIAEADKTGFGATLFEQAGEKVLAIRGTEPNEDEGVDLWQADFASIGVLGVALPQAVSMVNLLLRLKAPQADTAVPQLKITTSLTRQTARSVAFPGTKIYKDEAGEDVVESVTVYVDLTAENPAEGLGLITATDSVTLSGHSLGGHLAVLTQRLFPEQFQSQTYVYNAPGFDPTGVNFLPLGLKQHLYDGLGPEAGYIDIASYQKTNELVELFRDPIAPNALPGFDVSKIVNIESEDVRFGNDTSIVASIITGQQVLGEQVDVATEPNSHVIEPTMDALALHALFNQLDPTLTIAQTNRLFAAASSQVRDSEEPNA